ncbi:MAG: outer membrane protein assembly factor BamD [Gemmatimonadetes bacterium]|nr:outer membrane protein assembly factor BamD [Gemmatimonadota bacterium]
MRCGVLVAGVLVACGGGPREPAPVIPADTLYTQAMRAYRRGDCTRAREAFRQLADGLPANAPPLAEAWYYQAECDYADRLYLEASRQFRRVADEYGAHPLAADALLRAGDAQAELWKDPELDPEYGHTAMTTYQELAARFPDSRAAARAGPKARRLMDMVADKEYRTGLFYRRLKAYDSAILYFRSVVADYPQSRSAPRALLKLVEIYRILQYAEERRETCEHLHRYYPQAAGLAQACPPAADTTGAR